MGLNNYKIFIETEKQNKNVGRRKIEKQNKNGKNIEKQNKNSVKNRKTKQKCGKKKNRKTKQKCGVGWVIRGNSIVALFSLWVREVLGSIPSCPLFLSLKVFICSYSSVG